MLVNVINLQRVMQEFRNLDREMQAQTILAFLYIAERDLSGVTTTIQDVGIYLDLTSASATRNVQALGEWHRYKRPGHGLVVTVENPQRRNEKFIKLSDKGQRFINKIGGILHANQSAREQI